MLALLQRAVRPARCAASAPRWLSATTSKPIFFDMVHSNNAARVRLWIALKENMKDEIDVRMITYPDLQTPEFMKVNPLKKVPGYIRPDGVTVFESKVILSYLEDKYSSHSPSFLPPTPEGRQLMDLIIRLHDLYISSPNITAPGHSHSQGAMYLSEGWHGKARSMSMEHREQKLAEIWKQLSWLEENFAGPYLAGDDLSLADFSWFPTAIFMEFMLPHVFGWPDIFDEAVSPFPRLATWYTNIRKEPAFAKVHDDIWGYWIKMEADGQFKPILEEIKNDTTGKKFKYP